MSKLAPYTIQDKIDGGYNLHAYCHNPKCQHHQRLDLEKLKAKLGPDHSTMRDDLVPKLKCSKCGGKDIGLILSPDTGTRGNNPYRKAKGV